MNVLDISINLLIVVSAASSFGFLLGGENREFAQVSVALITILGLSQIVLRISSAANAHAEWYRRWRRLLLEVENSPEPGVEDLHAWNKIKTEIESECVSELRALEVDCRNNAIISLDWDSKEIKKIKLWQRWIIQIGTFQSEFPPLEDRNID